MGLRRSRERSGTDGNGGNWVGSIPGIPHGKLVLQNPPIGLFVAEKSKGLTNNDYYASTYHVLSKYVQSMKSFISVGS